MIWQNNRHKGISTTRISNNQGNITNNSCFGSKAELNCCEKRGQKGECLSREQPQLLVRLLLSKRRAGPNPLHDDTKVEFEVLIKKNAWSLLRLVGCTNLKPTISGLSREKTQKLLMLLSVACAANAQAQITFRNVQFWSQNSAGIEDATESSDRLGDGLAADDFDGDGRGDLAIGVPVEGARGSIRSGAVNVLYGSASGLTAVGEQLRDQ